MIKQTIQQKAVKLTERGVPQERAMVKAEGTVVGSAAAFVGMLLAAAAGGLGVVAVLKGVELTLVLALVVGVVGFLGLFLFAVGMTLISRDASPMIANMGELLVKIVRAVRGAKNGGQ